MNKYFQKDEIFQYKITDTSVIPFSAAVTEACERNLCGRYGKCWTCPPGVGEREALEKKIKSYKTAVVFTSKHELEDSFDFEGMISAAKKSENTLLQIMEELKRDNMDFMALGCEGCNICEKCTYPDSPCRFPEKATPSVEACGINVVELSRKLNINYNNGPDTVTYFCIVLLR